MSKFFSMCSMSLSTTLSWGNYKRFNLQMSCDLKAVLLKSSVGLLFSFWVFFLIFSLLGSDTCSSCTWLGPRSCSMWIPMWIWQHPNSPILCSQWVHWWSKCLYAMAFLICSDSFQVFPLHFCALDFNTVPRPHFESPYLLSPLLKLFLRNLKQIIWWSQFFLLAHWSLRSSCYLIVFL